jgi:UrcA family protein
MNKTITNTIRAMTICAATIIGAGANHASAADVANNASVSDGVRTYVVRFNDLDLTRIEGTTALYGRLRGAASRVCEPLQSRQMELAANHHACMDQAVADAVAKVNRPMLSQYHQQRTNGAGLVRLAQAN